MELLPYLDVNNERVLPKLFCDETCKRIFFLYRKWFLNGRDTTDYARLRDVQKKVSPL